MFDAIVSKNKLVIDIRDWRCSATLGLGKKGRHERVELARDPCLRTLSVHFHEDICNVVRRS